MGSSDINIYCSYLEEIKERLFTIKQFTQGSTRLSDLNRKDYDIEFIAIQLRKVLELIAFSSLITNKDVYSKAYINFEKHWNAKYMFRDLEKVNPDFYPKPIYVKGQNESGLKHLDYLVEGFLTQKEFLFLYERCSKALHAINPYSNGSEIINLKRSVDEWVKRITSLLYFHEIKLVGSDEIWVVYLEYPPHNKVTALRSSPS